MKNPPVCYLSVLVIFALFLSGCANESTGGEEKNQTKKFSVGESASVDGMNITVYSVRYARVIDERGEKFLAVTASNGKKFLIVDMSLENTDPSRIQVINTMLNSEVSDSAGYKSKPAIPIMGALQKGLRAGELAPGETRRGEVGYEVMEDSKDYVLSYNLNPVHPAVQYNL